MRTFELRDGDRMPALGLGTWKSEPGEVYSAVKHAVRIGYRHFDCAPIYGNESEVGRALYECMEEGLVTRGELWVTSKLWNDAHATGDVVPALSKSLEDLKLDFLDLFLIHWPVALRMGVGLPESAADLISLDEQPLAGTWKGMEAAVDAGLCRHIGVSNFSATKIAGLLDVARLAPEVNQVELHPYLQQGELFSFCRQKGILLTAYSPLGSRDRPDFLRQEGEPVLLEDPTIEEIAGRTGATPAQVLIAWAIQRGTSVIPKSVDPQRMKQNLDAAEKPLAGEDMRRIAGLDRHLRYVLGDIWAVKDGPYTVANLWDE